MATRSPPRSPRMSSLLSVLEGVIGPDDTGFAQGGALGEKVGQARVVEGLGGLALSGMSAQSRRVGALSVSMHWCSAAYSPISRRGLCDVLDEAQ